MAFAETETEMSTAPQLTDDDSANTASTPRQESLNLIKDICLWEKKKLSALVLVISTAAWVMLEVYGFNFIPVVCWAAMFFVTFGFLWGNLARLFHKEMPALSTCEVSEESAMASQNTIRVSAEEATRWMLRVGAEDNWLVLVGTVAGLWLLSRVAGALSFLSFLYCGVLIGLTVPYLLSTYEENLREFSNSMKMRGRRLYRTVGDKLHRKTESEHKFAEDKAKNKIAEDKAKNKIAEDKEENKIAEDKEKKIE